MSNSKNNVNKSYRQRTNFLFKHDFKIFFFCILTVITNFEVKTSLGALSTFCNYHPTLVSIDSSNIIENREYQWFLVQYDKGPQKFVRKIVRSNEIIWNSHLQQPTETNDSQYREQVLIRDRDQVFLGYIIHKAINEQDALNQNKFLQFICIQLLHTPHELNAFVENLNFNHNFWLLVMYTTETATINGEQSVFAIFHKNEVILKRDNQSNNIVAFVQEQHSTHKGVVIKITYDLKDLMFTMDIIKNDVIKTFKENAFINHENYNQKLHDEINQMEQRMYKESNILMQAFQAVDKSKTRSRQRLAFLKDLVKINNFNNYY